MPRWIIREERRSIIEKEVEADTEWEANAIAAGMDGTETDNLLYDSTTTTRLA